MTSGSNPSPARPLFQATFGNLNRRSPTAINTQHPDRGPALLISRQKDQTARDAAIGARYKLCGESTAVIDLNLFADRGHSLTTDGDWRPVADFVLGWLAWREISSTPPSESRLP
jgi:non-heme chloroperoxidase